jgi:hypothetical protein
MGLDIELDIGLLLLSGSILGEMARAGNRLRLKRSTSADHLITIDSSTT